MPDPSPQLPTSEMSTTNSLRNKTWTKHPYEISTDPSRIPIPTLNEIFSRPDFYWAKSLPDQIMHETLQNSLCFGLYDTAIPPLSPNHFLGFARCVTDFTTFLYLTDVYVSPTHQGQNLGKWLITCVQEVIDTMPYLRRSMLFTSDWKRSVPFYEKLMGMSVLECVPGSEVGAAIMEKKGPANPWLVEKKKAEEKSRQEGETES